MHDHKIPTVVVTGPAGAGKTSLCQILSEIYKNEICYLPETATTIVEHASISIPKQDDHHTIFQKSLYDIQDIFERLTQNKAREEGKKIILLDRGTVDMVAYTRLGEDEFLKYVNTSIEDEYKRYDYCIFLSPIENEKVYEIARPRNAARYENYTEMLKTSDHLKSLWEKHPNFISIKNESNFSRTALSAIEALAKIIGEKRLDV